MGLTARRWMWHIVHPMDFWQQFRKWWLHTRLDSTFLLYSPIHWLWN